MGSYQNNCEIMREQGECSSTSRSSDSPYYFLEKYTLYETHSNFYITGRDAKKKYWRVLKISRTKPSELVTHEDPTIYSSETCRNLLRKIGEENKESGGLRKVTKYYGIVGFIKILGTYYMLLITKRREIGKICEHSIYSISESKMIPISHSNPLTYMYNHTKENRYKKLLQLVDITDNFYFSCSYPLMHKVQQNLSQQDTEPSFDGKMFVWNEYLTHQTRAIHKNTLWTVALIHGFFKQVKMSTAANKTFVFTLIARRSCQYAGTRFEKRGVNEMGQAANEVEIEQIVWPHIVEEGPRDITSAVQLRASIPLRWSQKPSVLTIKPEIIISGNNDGYSATRLHFESLHLRYGVPTFILNLVKSEKKTHREYPLHEEFQRAVDYINTGLAEEDRVRFLNLDLDDAFKSKEKDEFKELEGRAKRAVKATGIFHSRMPQHINFKASSDFKYRIDKDTTSFLGTKSGGSSNVYEEQKGILRSNCLDSLDRTNVAQYVYGLVALAYQLNALHIKETRMVDFQDSLTIELMNIYQAMGDALSQQYGGSPAQQKIFAKFRGQNKLTAQVQEYAKSFKRLYSNAFSDGTKQHAIDLFLGKILPEVEVKTPARRTADQKDFCEWLTSIYLRNVTRCNTCIYSGFERLWYEDGAEEFNRRCLPGPSGSSRNGSQDGHRMVDFSAGS